MCHVFCSDLEWDKVIKTGQDLDLDKPAINWARIRMGQGGSKLDKI